MSRMRDNTVGKVAFQFLRHTIASIFLITLFAETAFCNDFNIGPIGINDTWQLTDIDIGWSPVGGISVTGYIGSFALPVNDVYSGNWSDPTTWSLSNIVVLYDRAKAWQDFLTGQSGVEYSNGNVSFAWQGLTQGLGPTEQSVTFPIPLLDYSPIVNVNIGTKLEYNVTLSHNILLDQDATLNFLSVQPGARLDFQAGKSMVLRTGISENAGTITGAVLSIQDGGTLTNQGSFEWKGGSIGGSGGLTNQGSFTISGNGGQTVGYCIDAGWGYFAPGALTNSGTITHAADGVLHMVKDSTLNNLAGAVYDMQGDVLINGLTVGWSWPITSSGGTINNAGLFRKSAGTGTATIDSTYFNNTGTVEVDSGTLSLYQLNNSGSVNVYGTALNVTNGGSSVDRHYEFTNGGRLNGSLTWQGENTANGNGVLAVGGNVAAGTTAKFASSQFTNGAQLEVGSGYSNKLNVETGSTLMLDMTGSQQATMVSGMIDGDGTTINTGNFAFSGGQIGRYGTGSFINQGNFTWTGGSTGGNGGIANQNNITISGNGNQTIGYCIDAGWGYFAPGALTNSGTITHAADGVLHMVKDSTLNNLAGAVYDMQGDVLINGLTVGWSWPITSSGGTINNAGLFRKSAGTGTATIDSTYFNNTGTVEVDNGTLTFGNFSQTAGSTDLNGGNLAFSSPAQILGGDVVGSGIINGSIVNSGGLLSPGHSAGMITINGNYTQDPDGMLLMEIAGLGSGQFDVLNVTGIAYLDGLLEISLLNGFSPTLGDTFDILNFGSYSGQFAMVQGLDLGCGKYFELDYSANGLRLTSVPEPSSLYLAVIGSLWLIRRKWRTVGQ